MDIDDLIKQAVDIMASPRPQARVMTQKGNTAPAMWRGSIMSIDMRDDRGPVLRLLISGAEQSAWLAFSDIIDITPEA